MNNNVHIGEIIYNVLVEDGHAVSWLAKKLHYDKSNVYRIFKNPTINTQLLLKISRLLKYDFFHHYSTIIQENNERIENS